MDENQTSNQRIETEQEQEQNQIQNPLLRRPPMAGGPKRVSEEQTTRPMLKKSVFRKMLPYLIVGGSTGTGIGFAINTFLS